MGSLRFFTVLIIIAGHCLLLTAQSGEGSPLSTGGRVALVIGNSDYTAGPLPNPGNDAKAISAALRYTGFEVLEHTNLETQAGMKRAVREFGRKIQNGSVGLFYFAGHGIQVSGRNYLIPTKAEIHAMEEVEYESLDVGFILAQMEIAKNRMNILILDACRNNPFARNWRSASSGLAFMNAPSGTLIAYATAPGSVASDGTDSNGLYTEELLKQIRIKGQKIEDVFKNVRAGVMRRSNHLQIPWESSSLVGDFYFIRPEPVSGVPVEDEKIPEILEPTGLAKWKREGDGYRFYQSGVEVTYNTNAAMLREDALLHDRSTGRNYYLGKYSTVKGEKLRDAREIVSRSNAFWIRERKNEFRFYYRGNEETSRVNHAWFKDGLIIYLPGENRYFHLPGFEEAEINKLYKAPSIFSSNHTLWWTDSQYYYLYVKGEQVASRTRWQWSGNDLIVYDETGRSSYRLPDYYNHSDEKPRPAEVIAAPGEITWTKHRDNTYWLKRNGIDVERLDTENVFSGNDLLVFDRHSLQDFLLKNFRNREYDKACPAEILWSEDHAFWRRSGNRYWLYVRGKLIAEQSITGLNGQDLEVSDPETGLTWVLEDCGILDDNTLRPAIMKKAANSPP